jgi:hypothetical protein
MVLTVAVIVMAYSVSAFGGYLRIPSVLVVSDGRMFGYFVLLIVSRERLSIERRVIKAEQALPFPRWGLVL